MDSTLRTVERVGTEAEADVARARAGDALAAARVQGRDLAARAVARLDWSDPAVVSRAVCDWGWAEEQLAATASDSDGSLALPQDAVCAGVKALRAEGEARWMGARWVGAVVVRFSCAGPCLQVGRVDSQTAKTWALVGRTDVANDTGKPRRVTPRPGTHHVAGACGRCSGRESYPMGYMD